MRSTAWGRRLIRRFSFLFFFCTQQIISVLLKDLDVFAEHALASLDPLLCNVQLVGGIPLQESTKSTHREPRVGIGRVFCVIASR
jgi:hypothetical protein